MLGTRRKIWIGLLVGALTGALTWSVAQAEGVHTDEAAKTLYLHYCSSCHGENGTGDGDLASILELKPTDLTQFGKNSPEGAFSYGDLLRSIDGRRPVRGHGKPGMPVWGDVFVPDQKAPLNELMLGAGKLLLITYHVESLQKK